MPSRRSPIIFAMRGGSRTSRGACRCRVPSTLNRAAIRSKVTVAALPAVYKRHSRWLTVAEWRALGVVPAGSGLPDNELATLMETPWRLCRPAIC